MHVILDLNFDPFPYRGGWILGLVLVMAGLAVLAARYLAARGGGAAPRSWLQVVGGGLCAGGLVWVLCSLPVLVDAAAAVAGRLADAETAAGRPTAAVDVPIPARPGRAAFAVRVTYPVGTRGGPGLLGDLDPEGGVAPVIVNLPGNGLSRMTNDSTARFLASRGYVVMAIDDIDNDPPTEPGPAIPPLHFNYATWSETLQTMHVADDKAQRQAARALEALDGVFSRLSPEARARMQLQQVAMWGFSFGGATAAQSALMDRRVAAVADEDGSLFGASARGESPVPFLSLWSYEPMDASQLSSPNPAVRDYALEAAADHHLLRGLLQRPEHYGYILHGPVHESFSDLIFSRRFLTNLLVVSPYRVRSERRAYLLAFFDRYLRGRPAPLLERTPSPFANVQALKQDAGWAAAVDAVPVTAAERRLLRPN